MKNRVLLLTIVLLGSFGGASGVNIRPVGPAGHKLPANPDTLPLSTTVAPASKPASTPPLIAPAPASKPANTPNFVINPTALFLTGINQKSTLPKAPQPPANIAQTPAVTPAPAPTQANQISQAILAVNPNLTSEPDLDLLDQAPATTPEVPSMVISVPAPEPYNMHRESVKYILSDLDSFTTLNGLTQEQKGAIDQVIHEMGNLVLLEHILALADMKYEQLVAEDFTNKLDRLDQLLLNLDFEEYQRLVGIYAHSGDDTAKLNRIIKHIQMFKPELNLVALEYLLTKFGGNHAVLTIDDLVNTTLANKQARLTQAFNETKTSRHVN